LRNRGAEQSYATFTEPQLKAVLIEACSAQAEATIHEHEYESYSYDVFPQTLMLFRNAGFQPSVLFIHDIDFVQQRLWIAQKFTILRVDL
jgi:hypothetical protein